GSWYTTLAKPDFTPPDGVFAPVWIALYLMMAVAGWRVWRKAGFDGNGGVAMGLFGTQLALNLLWPVLFFGLQRIDWALIDIALLWLAIVATVFAFWRIDGFAAVLLLPYLAWVSFAAALNHAIWRLN
ncbi:MAG TPA: TspO/MBR family protein, partial [Rhodospirillales bacterium]|nr:TspO/MBR family protein [Rhodospirillales bacterium]